MSERIQWIDIAKGLGITLVVAGHTIRGLLNSDLQYEGTLLPLLDRLIYTFHMPLFFILAGVTFALRPPSNLYPAVMKRSWRLFYAMVIWTYIFLAAKALAGDYSNSGGSITDLLVAPLPPVAHFWFLWALLIITAIFAALRIVSSSFASDTWFWAISIPTTLGLAFFVNLAGPAYPFFGPALLYSLPFATGALIATSPLLRKVPSRPVSLSGLALFALGIGLGILTEDPNLKIIAGTMISLCLLPPLARVSSTFNQVGWLHHLAFIGRISLPIYVMHTIFSASFRIALIQFGFYNIYIHLFIGLIVGVAGPLLAYIVGRRLGLLKVLGLA